MPRVIPRHRFHLRDDSRPVDLLGEVHSHIDPIPVESPHHTHTAVVDGAPLVPAHTHTHTHH